jgi:hypothetical protein
MVAKALFPALLGVALAGCGATPFEYRPDTELSERPGMFSGEKGAFVFRSGEAARSSDYEEFKRWKSSGERSEQREFQEWREWREWNRRQKD